MINAKTPVGEVAKHIERVFERYGLRPNPDGWRDLALALMIDISTASERDLKTGRQKKKGMHVRELADVIGIRSHLAIEKPPQIGIASEQAIRFSLMDSLTSEIDPNTSKLRTAKDAADLTVEYLAAQNRQWGGDGKKGIPTAGTIRHDYAKSTGPNLEIIESKEWGSYKVERGHGYRPATKDVVEAILGSAYYDVVLRRIGKAARSISKDYPGDQQSPLIRHVLTLPVDANDKLEGSIDN